MFFQVISLFRICAVSSVIREPTGRCLATLWHGAVSSLIFQLCSCDSSFGISFDSVAVDLIGPVPKLE